MQKQKRGFWLFIFSLIPGAGEMYMGFKKQGISIMFLFWGVFAIGACTGMDWLVFLIPIIWFYSFFNVHNLKSLSEEEFYSIEDSYAPGRRCCAATTTPRTGPGSITPTATPA